MADPPVSVVNKGWTIHGLTYHRAEWWNQEWRKACDKNTHVGMLDQTLFRNGEPTGALVPTDLRPCKRCFPHGDA